MASYAKNTNLIVERVVSLLESDMGTDSSIADQLKLEFEINDDEAEYVIELTKTGLFRAQIESAGMKYPINNLNDNPIVNAALKIGREKLSLPDKKEVAIFRKKPWWKFW